MSNDASASRPSSTEEALELFLEERKRGGRSDPASFAARHPELGPELESALAAWLALEHATRASDSGALPERIGAFRIVREIGRGGMGVVLEAVEEPLNRRVALKVLPAELLASASARARFRREAELAARLDHSGIATVYGAGVDDAGPWIAMRYVEGKTLARWISDARAAGARSVRFGPSTDTASARKGARSESGGRSDSSSHRASGRTDATSARAQSAGARARAPAESTDSRAGARADSEDARSAPSRAGARSDPTRSRSGAGSDPTSSRAGARSAALSVAMTIERVARALHSAHEQGVVHRDVKPSNVIIGADGAPVIVDFGLALEEEADGHSLTRTGETAGTPAYFAPEIVSGERARPDAQSDVYALGVTLYECLTLRRPFEAPTPIALYRAIATEATPDVRALNRDVPRDLAVVVATALERDRARRYASAAALADDLEACAAGHPIAARPVPITGKIARWMRREPRQAALASFSAVATIAAAVFFGTWWQSLTEVRAAERLTRYEKLEMALQNGYIRIATNWHPEAEESFQEALAIDPGNVEAIAGRALSRMKAHRDAEAVTILADAPPTPVFEALRAVARGEVPVVELGAEWFATAPPIEMFIDGMRLTKQMERAPHHEHPALAALAYVRFDEAVKRSKTQRLFYQTQRMRAARDADDEAAVRSAAAALVVLWPDASRALFEAAMGLYPYDPKAAIPLLESVVRMDPNWGAAHQNLGNARFRIRDYEGAERAQRRAIAIDPRDADAYNSLGLVYDNLDCYEDARAAFLGALAIRPMWQTWANLGEIDAAGTRPEEAVFELEMALRYVPRQPVVRITLARLLHDLGRVEDAIAELEIIVGFEPGDRAAWSLYSTWQSELGNDEQSELAAEIGTELAARR